MTYEAIEKLDRAIEEHDDDKVVEWLNDQPEPYRDQLREETGERILELEEEINRIEKENDLEELDEEYREDLRVARDTLQETKKTHNLLRQIHGMEPI